MIEAKLLASLSVMQAKGLVTNNGEGGHVKFYPYEKGRAEKVLAMLKGGGHKVLG